MNQMVTRAIFPIFLFLVGLGLTSSLLSSVAADEPEAKTESKQELWFGTMTVEGVRQFRFQLDMTPKDEEWSGVLTSFDEGGRRFDVSDLERTESGFSFDLRKTGATYAGTYADDLQTIDGSWKQGSGNLKLQFRRVEKAPPRKIKSALKGQINAVIQKIDVAFVELESGQLIFDSIGQKVGGFIAKDESTDDEVVYKVPAIGATFKGRYSEDKSKIEGKWSQGVVSLTLVLSKVDVAELDPKDAVRPQTPKAPFPYESREVTFSSRAKDVSLSGTLTLPRKKLSGAVVLISGSGPQDRDETLLEHKPFLVIADYFARNGIATLRFDDRGVGRSKGDFSLATTFDFADDAEGALEHLRSLPELSEVPIGLCGHSEGGLIAPIVAARNNNVDYIIMMAGPGVNGEQILYNQSQLIMKAEGTSEKDLKTAEKFQHALVSTVVQNLDASVEVLEARVNEVLKAVLSAEELAEEGVAGKITAGVAQLASPWMRAFLTLEPKISLEKVQCPVLVINGEKDLQVDPNLNLPAIRASLKKAGNTRFEIVEYPGLNHLFQKCETGSVSEYQGIEETFNEKPLKKMAEWIRGIGR